MIAIAHSGTIVSVMDMGTSETKRKWVHYNNNSIKVENFGQDDEGTFV